MTILALAGRRVDAVEANDVNAIDNVSRVKDRATPRFPSANVATVRQLIRGELVRSAVRVLVCSAACGADLIALDVAGELGIRRRVVLPFERARFRETSVVDRGAEWGPLFDRILADVQERGDLVTLGVGSGGDEAAYAAANAKILDEAQTLATGAGDVAAAMLVWDQRVRGAGDLTEAFGREARLRGLPVLEVSTVSVPDGRV